MIHQLLQARGRLHLQLAIAPGFHNHHNNIYIVVYNDNASFLRLKCFIYLGFLNFGGGSDWGGKYVGYTRATWLKCFLELDSNDPIIET